MRARRTDEPEAMFDLARRHVVRALLVIALVWRIGFAIAVAEPPKTDGSKPTDTDVIKSAEDAFGLSIGTESLGLYTEDSVRGFSPLIAGNARIDGLYFDRQGPIPNRLVNDRRIRVGLSALGFPWPAPTGIVDYWLRQATGNAALSSIFYRGPFDAWAINLDGHIPIAGGRAGLAAGLAYRDDEVRPGQTQRIAGYALISEWTPTSNMSVRVFWGRRDLTDAKTMPTVYSVGNSLPTRIDARYFGQAWAEGRSYSEHYGLLADAGIFANWSVKVGIFRSTSDVSRSYADLYLDAQADGTAQHVFVADPHHRAASTSGELHVSRVFSVAKLEQQISAGIRARDVRDTFGGSDEVDVGRAIIGRAEPLAPATFVFGPVTADHVNQWAGCFSDIIRWRDRAETTIGVQKTTYDRQIDDPVRGISRHPEAPWLYNASLALLPWPGLTVYAALTRGLEDSGVAPASSTNRGESLGASITYQHEAGIRFLPLSGVSLVAAAFEVRKPYFDFSDNGSFVEVGNERHKGIELSVIWKASKGLNVVAGALLMSPHVSIHAAESAQVGTAPIGQTGRVVQLSMDYHFAAHPGLSLDGTFTHLGAIPASQDNRLKVPPSATLDIGGRYEFNFGRFPATLRLQLLNATNTFTWYVVDTNGFQPLEPRRALAYLSLDM